MRNLNTQLPIITGQPKVLSHAGRSAAQRIPCAVNPCKDEYGNVVTTAHGHIRLGQPGAGKLEPKANGSIVYHTPWLTAANRKPFVMQPLNARKDKDASKAFDRIRKDIGASAVELGVQSNPKVPKQGATATKGYEVVTTDGLRALLIPGDGGIGQAIPNLGDTKGHIKTIIDNPEFHLALKRAMLAAGPGNCVRLTCIDSVLTIESSDGGVLFDESISVQNKGEWRIGLNVDYLEVLCGTWPLTVYVKDDIKAIVFEPADKSWRYVLMPMRVEWNYYSVSKLEKVSSTPIR